jgi:hypothetical protein
MRTNTSVLATNQASTNIREMVAAVVMTDLKIEAAGVAMTLRN